MIAAPSTTSSSVIAQISAGFADRVHDAQTAFRSVLDALSRPGRSFSIGSPVKGLPLGSAMAHLLLTLTDENTPVWWQFKEGAGAAWLRFHTSAPAVLEPNTAAFAVVVDVGHMPPLDTFSEGSLASPERSTTLLVEVQSLHEGPDVEWRGPGIEDLQIVRIAGLQDDFWTQWKANQAAFPQGVDIVFTCGNAAIGLPRTTRMRRSEAM